MEVKNNIIDYINEHGISADRISKETGINRDKIIKESSDDINATEFLTLCEYLKVNPRSFYGCGNNFK